MKNSRTKTRVAILVTMCMALTVDVATGADSNRRLLPFQGRLTDSNGVPVSGTHNLTFSLYTEPDAQNCVWAESLSTTLSDGRFGLVLGRSTSFDDPDGDPCTPAVSFAVPLYMGIKVGTDDEMRPRKQVIPALYAQDANYATYAGEALNLKGVVHVTEDGNVGIGTYGPTEKLDVAGNVAISGNATITGNVGIGTTSPSVKLEVKGRIKDETGFIMPVGTILAYSAPNAPSGWLLCDGSSYSTSAYPDLFALIQYTFGGSGGSFNVPDFRGRFLRGWADGQDTDPNREDRTEMNTGGNTGDSIGSVQSDEYESHQHSYSAVWWSGTDDKIPGGGGYFEPYGGLLTKASGGNETRPKNAYVNFIIKY
jgi:hypothetical protein